MKRKFDVIEAIIEQQGDIIRLIKDQQKEIDIPGEKLFKLQEIILKSKDVYEV